MTTFRRCDVEAETRVPYNFNPGESARKQSLGAYLIFFKLL